MSNSPSLTVGIVGATGAVGQELLRLLHERNFPMATLRLFASARSVGKIVECAGKKYTVEEAKEGVFGDVDIAFFATDGAITKALAPDAVKAGCVVIDKSSAFRMDPAVPLVIPEINPQGLRQHKGIIANPNCSTAVTLMALWPLHQAFGLKRYFAATYQSVSGTGTDAVEELE
ncbi:MAG TPA: aspartate-semialdehyde dehydrogenase, partial [Opitutus sp.]|nr:aspartate-semialdehyde dehydrogenase [Opitutus sp.]